MIATPLAIAAADASRIHPAPCHPPHSPALSRTPYPALLNLNPAPSEPGQPNNKNVRDAGSFGSAATWRRFPLRDLARPQPPPASTEPGSQAKKRAGCRIFDLWECG